MLLNFAFSINLPRGNLNLAVYIFKMENKMHDYFKTI